MPAQLKTWTRPQLIVLCRGKPEEKVLLACKVGYKPGGPGGADHACNSVVNNACSQCGTQSLT